LEYLIYNKGITQSNIEIDKRKGNEYKINRNNTLLIFHNYTKSLHQGQIEKKITLVETKRNLKLKLYLKDIMKFIF
jgi:hypothetical protein